MTPSQPLLTKVSKNIALLSALFSPALTQLCFGAGDIVIVENFDNLTAPNQAQGWAIGSQAGGATTIEKDPFRTGKALKAHYPLATGAVYNWASYDLTQYSTRDIYVEFDARMPGTPQGIKFFKIFGQNDADNDYINTTFGLITDNGAGSMTQISFADGTDTSGDVRNVVNLDGSNPEWVGRSWTKGAQVYTRKTIWSNKDWGDGWHHFETHIKFNSGSCVKGQPLVPEVNDGAYLLKIDGVVYVDAKNLFNRHCKNLPIRAINFFDWADKGTVPFDTWLDNIKITIVGTTAAGADAKSVSGSSSATTTSTQGDPPKNQTITDVVKNPAQ